MGRTFDASVVHIGEGFCGSGASAAHVNTVYGARSGPAGAAFATALATPSSGHIAFLCVLAPGMPAVPATLFVNKATYTTDDHRRATWGPAQAGVAEGVRDAQRAGLLPSIDDCCVIAAVWVDPEVTEADFQQVFTNNKTATFVALRAGAAGTPTAEAADASGPAWNPYFDSRGQPHSA